jgi:hypothetical protein
VGAADAAAALRVLPLLRLKEGGAPRGGAVHGRQLLLVLLVQRCGGGGGASLGHTRPAGRRLGWVGPKARALRRQNQQQTNAWLAAG